MVKNRIDLAGGLFLIYFIVLQLVNSLTGIYSNVFIILGVIAYVLYLYFYYKRFLLRFSFIIFYILSNILGVYVIETTNLYLGEFGYSSYNKNSLLLIVIAHIIFIEVIRLYRNSNKCYSDYNLKDYTYILTNKVQIKKINILKLFLILIFIINLILFLQVLDKPFFYLKIDRFIYKEQYLSKLSDILTNSYLYIAPIIGIYYYKTKDKKVFILLGSMFIYLFWIGNKFSLFLDLVYNIGLIFVVTIDYDKLNKIFSKLLMLVCVLFCIIFFQNFVIWNQDFNENLEYLNRRISQQGQLWWGIYNNDKAKENNLDELTDEIDTYFRRNIPEEEKFNSGIYKMMKITTKRDIFTTKIYVKKSRYAYSTQATIYYYFKNWGLIVFSFISALVYLFINNNLVKSMVSMRIISSILWARLSVMLGRVLIQSDFDKLFSIETILICIILILLEFIGKKKR